MRLRESLSAKTPANGATNKNGSILPAIKAVAAKGEPENIRTSPNSAMNENQVPSSLITCPVHSRRKSLLLKSSSLYVAEAILFTPEKSTAANIKLTLAAVAVEVEKFLCCLLTNLVCVNDACAVPISLCESSTRLRHSESYSEVVL
jgi:hypothetical protein